MDICTSFMGFQYNRVGVSFGVTIMMQTDFRNLVVGTETTVPLLNGTYVTAINFDNAATTPPLYSVIKELNDFSPWYSSIHRGKGYKSDYSSQLYDKTRDLVKHFVNADPEKDVVIYTKSTTESINMLSRILKEEADGRDVIISTFMEHSSNDLPWRGNFKVEYVEIDAWGRLSLEDLEARLRRNAGKVELVAVTGVSNVTGYINPVHTIARLAHHYGTQILVDGAQWVPHMRVDMKPFDSPEHIDFMAFSAHKMYAPYGIGVLIGPGNAFHKGLPPLQGGGATKLLTHEYVEWDEPPARFEAGTPNIMGVVALGAAIKALSSIGMDTLYRHEQQLLNYANGQMARVPGIRMLRNPGKDGDRTGVIPFTLEGIPHSLLAAMLSYEAGIAVRNGFFCSHPYSQKLLGLTAADMKYFFDNPGARRPGLVRVSFGIYNQTAEIDRLVYALHTFAMNKEFFINKYSSRSFPYEIPNDV